MENNAIIHGVLIDLLDVMDARARVNIYTDTTTRIFVGNVYEFLANKEIMKKYAPYSITGLTLGLITNILIEEV